MNNKVLYPELSYKLVGALFAVDNALGAGYEEKVYQAAVRQTLTDSGITFNEQTIVPIKINDAVVFKYKPDFVVEGKIVLELKVGGGYERHCIKQLYSYLQATGLTLGLLADFTSKGVRIKRIVNIN